MTDGDQAAIATATQGRPFEILPEHRMRPGWDWFVERLTRPTSDEAHDTMRDDRDVA
ncbi:MAG TPA: hypothetical protein PLR44_14210 [Thermomicrobiales bacterium]|jgi:hypothetical protein|nr:hypothetical protein [Thermomicrobiales bacterium]HRA32889.1 hypothetical protein [Thermomicrobiales bacterium]